MRRDLSPSQTTCRKLCFQNQLESKQQRENEEEVGMAMKVEEAADNWQIVGVAPV